MGDEAFQRKCLARIEQLAAEGCTVILVTHNSQLVIEFCHAAALLSEGELVCAGDPKTVIHEYYRSQGFALENADVASAGPAVTGGGFAAAAPVREGAYDAAHFDETLVSSSVVAYGNADVLIEDPQLLDAAGHRVNVLPRGGTFCLSYRVTLHKDAERLEFGSLIKTTKGVELGGLALGDSRELQAPRAGTVFKVSIPFVANLLPGTYFVNVGVRGNVEGVPEYLHRLMDAIAFRILEEADGGLRGMVDLSLAGKPPSFEIIEAGAAGDSYVG